ncbi:hypothetical protein CMT41_02185 [Colwellia sp. MT41]|nr:hypothetical protein CMT41_02185 [Colwellia sp. MT41]
MTNAVGGNLFALIPVSVFKQARLKSRLHMPLTCRREFIRASLRSSFALWAGSSTRELEDDNIGQEHSKMTNAVGGNLFALIPVSVFKQARLKSRLHMPLTCRREFIRASLINIFVLWAGSSIRDLEDDNIAQSTRR